MKNVIFITLVSLFSVASFASAIKPCSESEIQDLKKTLKEMAVEQDLHNSFLLKNLASQVVGVFATNNQDGVFSEICESVASGDLTVSNSWFYWDANLPANPAQWTREASYFMSQDEGMAAMRMLEVEPVNGNVTVEFKVIGWTESDEVEVKSDVVKFEKVSNL